MPYQSAQMYRARWQIKFAASQSPVSHTARERSARLHASSLSFGVSDGEVIVFETAAKEGKANSLENVFCVFEYMISSPHSCPTAALSLPSEPSECPRKSQRDLAGHCSPIVSLLLRTLGAA